MIEPIQVKLMKTGLTYECMNEFCFFQGTYMNYSEVDYKHVWNSQLGDLDLVPICPSCSEEVAFWHIEDE